MPGFKRNFIDICEKNIADTSVTLAPAGGENHVIYVIKRPGSKTVDFIEGQTISGFINLRLENGPYKEFKYMKTN